ncbi:hypothetical protein JQ617_29185 [Bradyrhizobium sp. KB893862 SZCCT0404]|uniref:hypothetical protein n=1 Tax=Bradyrhizobium sp. KB893862 SZCCT0404 TaxID=2807672 RepID=UPI001BA87486|nr:hypothetical protein [Bradyrhizobium sp. KB893862 SZCCT0404]MBR1178066.1 hypothetical protein [Bradyrhizobium sp. KB893862 SZCCT0404]
MAMDWGHDLMLRHRRLFVVKVDEPLRSAGYPFCGRGWADIMERLCRRIEGALRDGETFEFVSIRQKLGVLRANWTAEASEDTEDTIGQAVNLAIAGSACTCEISGGAARLYNNKGWLETRCAEDAVGEIVPPRYGAGSENVRRFRRCRAEIYFAHYDRETDTLTEVPSPSRRREG